MESDPGSVLKEVWVYLSDQEAVEVVQAISEYLSEPQAPGWHFHVTDADGNQLSIGIGEPDDPDAFAERFGQSGQ
jgi:hypothetical protein